ncbi:MAG: nicotinate (nicotinamide) nucleotide adenylyltransferase [bacterium]|nr:nicotinate (nicotinamide) nucleotide adenylyltransferase [bacterium]
MDKIKPVGKTGKIGLFFGSFNPITLGHMDVAQKSLEQGLDEVWFVVSPHNPHKFKKGILAHENHRWDMAQLAVCELTNPKIFATNIEFFQEKKPSFTHITLQELKADNPEADLIILCGTDTHHKIQIWRSGKWIHENFKFWVFPRGKDGHKPVKNKVMHERSNYLDVEIIEASSTAIRNKIATGEPIDGLTIEPVVEYMQEHQVYNFVKQ